jgi:uncharacterized protein (DUF2062 family)
MPIRERVRGRAMQWLRQGISPRRLALTLALGFAIGCIPVVGLPTLVCAAVALALRLNIPAIQAANYVAMPLQLALIVPFVRLGGKMTAAAPAPNAMSLLKLTPLHMASQMGWLAGEAMLAWLLVAIPAVLLITFALTPMLRRVPILAAAEAAD